MAIACEEINARLTELLYGELRADARAELEAHVAGCARCQADLAALQRTRAFARQALAADEPPARAHQAIRRAAAAALAAKQVAPAPIAARPAPPPASFWDWFRKRWTWPTFATIGAVAVVALASKIFLEPEKTVERGRELLRPAAVSAPAAPPPVGPGAAEEETTKNTGLMKAPADRALQAQPASSTARRDTAAPARHRAGKDAVGSGATPRGGPSDDVTASEGFAPPPPAVMKPAKRAFAPPPPGFAKKAAEAPSLDGFADAEVERKRDEAPGRAGGGAPASNQALAAPKAKKEAADKELAREAPAAAAVPAEPAPAPAAADRAARAEEESAPAESPVMRADRLFAQGRWADAARAYRELLRRDPRNADAARWRQRMAAAEAALAPPP